MDCEKNEFSNDISNSLNTEHNKEKTSTDYVASEENNGCSTNDISEDTDKSFQMEINFLRNELQKAYAEIAHLKIQCNAEKSQHVLEKDAQIDVINQRNKLLKILSYKDITIERMTSDISKLELQLTSAVSEKFDALARLDAVEGRELTILFKRKQRDMNNELQKQISENRENLPQQKDIHRHRKRKSQDVDIVSKTSSNVVRKRKRSRKDKNDISTMSSRRDENFTNRFEMGTKYPKKCDDGEGSFQSQRRSKANSNNDTNIQSELLSHVRTRRESQFVIDALSCSSKSNDISEDK